MTAFHDVGAGIKKLKFTNEVEEILAANPRLVGLPTEQQTQQAQQTIGWREQATQQSAERMPLFRKDSQQNTYLVGWKEIVGGREQTIGCDPTLVARAQQAQAQPMQFTRQQFNQLWRDPAFQEMVTQFRGERIEDRDTVIVKEKPFQNEGRLILPVSLPVGTTVAAGATQVITANPQMLFRVERIIISSILAPNFVIDDIKVGNRSQFVQQGVIPAVAFTETSFDAYVKMATLEPAIDFVLQVVNITLGASAFFAMALGQAVR